MSGFHFPLEKVLRWRSVQLAVEESKLKNVLQQQLRLQTLAAELGMEKSRLFSSLGTLSNLQGDDLGFASAYSRRLKQHAEKVAEHLALCEKDLRVRKKKYQEAQQRVQLLEQLKDRKRTAWQYDENRKLEHLASESYLATWNRDGL
jgi:flagellar export protein FliJ